MFGVFFLPHIKFKQINHKYSLVRVVSPKMPPTRLACNAVVPERYFIIIKKNIYIIIISSVINRKTRTDLQYLTIIVIIFYVLVSLSYIATAAAVVILIRIRLRLASR